MSTVLVRESGAALAERQREALISLLADDDPEVYQTIRTTILGYGEEAVAWLRLYTYDRDPLLRRRTQEIIHHITQKKADDAMVSFCLKQGEDLDIEKAALILSQTQYPDINEEAYSAQLDGFAENIRDKVIMASNSEDMLYTVSEYIFSELGFSPNEQNYYDPDNSYFSKVIDRRMGNPISLCLLFLLIGRRLNLPLVGIGMPGHFLCRYQTATEEHYVDVYNCGRLLTKGECIKYLQQTGYGYTDGSLAPITPKRMLLRMCANLHQVYSDSEQEKEVKRIQRYIMALSR